MNYSKQVLKRRPVGAKVVTMSSSREDSGEIQSTGFPVLSFRLWAALDDFSGHSKASVSFCFLFPSHWDNNRVDVESFNCYTGYSPLPLRPSPRFNLNKARSFDVNRSGTGEIVN